MVSFHYGNSIRDSGAAFGNGAVTLHRLHSGHENLPLYLDSDGFYSVKGPALHMRHNGYHTAHLWDNQILTPGGQSPCIPSQLCQLPIDTPNELPPPPSSSSATISLPAPSPRSPNSIRAFSQRSYTCNEPGCTWKSPFRTKQGLSRHHQSKHIQKRLGCPIRGCGGVGNKGVKRRDNLRVGINMG
ncbi:unnamed protein product [Tuber aestivum]|uniref:Uncharacterized protein n=1 Tax=Tuber aestivum TaxID=59557 RepID=A0A292Q2D5_9PEZI|nr:unnamed protein product [Tuber aestivum]